jgi:murein DD-endopeptidase MepM/ murein hydrolase activator NlpD
LTARKGKTRSALLSLLILGLAALAPSAGAQSTAEKLEAAKERLADIEAEAAEATARFDRAYGALTTTRDEIDATQRAMADARKRISGLDDQLDDRAREAYQQGVQTSWELLLEARSFTEFSDRLVYLERLAQDDADLATRVSVLAEELRRHEANLGRLEEDQQKVVAEADRQKQIVYDKLAEAQALREELQQQYDIELAASATFAGNAPASIATVSGAALQACPAPGTAFGDSFGAPRSGGRSHAGVDMMGGYGQPVYAALPGTLSTSSSSLGGNQAYVHSDGGTYTFYAHLQGFAGVSGSVGAGTLIGYIGDTGNATGTPHLHFEYHPGGVLVNPTPYVAAVC